MFLCVIIGATVCSGTGYGQEAAAQVNGAEQSQGQEAGEDFEEEEEGMSNFQTSLQRPSVKFQLKNNRDPMLSPEDVLLIRYREQQRLAAEAAERRRKAEEERKRREAEERRRQWELALIKDPTVLVRDKIRISGIIDKEVLIDGKLYTIGNVYKGAKIVSVGADSVTFSYKGHKFVKKVKI